jgi:hypothetical protein
VKRSLMTHRRRTANRTRVVRAAVTAGSLLALAAAAPAVVQAAAPQLQVDTARVVIGRRQAQLHIGCSGHRDVGACRGRLQLLAAAASQAQGPPRGRAAARTITIGSTTFSVPAGTTRIVALRLTAAARRILAGTSARHLEIVTRMPSGRSIVTSRSVPLQLVSQTGSAASSLLAVAA